MDTIDDARAEMSNYFIIGSLQSNLLDSMVQIMQEAYVPLVKTQFHEPQFMLEPDSQEDTLSGAGDSTFVCERMEKSCVTIKRPSDFRRMSLSAQKLTDDVESEKEPTEGTKKQPTKYELLDDVENLVDIVKW